MGHSWPGGIQERTVITTFLIAAAAIAVAVIGRALLAPGDDAAP
jgi:hypothetical protein